jgi:hypothetical protein
MVDGWGVLTTPYGAFETLRVRTELQQLDSIHIDSLGMGVPLYRESTTYKWLANGMGLPICEVTDNGVTQSISYIDSVRNILSVSTSSLDQHRLEIYPNPAKDHISIAGTSLSDGTWTLDLFDLAGRPVLTISGNSSASPVYIDLNGNDLKPGLYMLMLRSGKELVTDKLIIR